MVVTNNFVGQVSSNNELNLGEKLLIISLLYDKDNVGNFTNKAIAEKLCITPNSVARYLINLENLGYIEIAYYKKQGHTFRFIKLIKL